MFLFYKVKCWRTFKITNEERVHKSFTMSCKIPAVFEWTSGNGHQTGCRLFDGDHGGSAWLIVESNNLKVLLEMTVQSHP